MSGHSVSAVALFFSVIAIALASQYADISKPVTRAPAATKKDLLLGDTKGLNLKYTQKIRGPLSANIELIGATPEKTGDVYSLKGFVSSSEELRDVEFKWVLPNGLELVNGVLQGTISILKSDLGSEVQITVRNLEAVNHQVHLIVSGATRGMRFAESVQYNTLLQPVLNASKEELLQSTEKAIAEDSKRIRIRH